MNIDIHRLPLAVGPPAHAILDVIADDRIQILVGEALMFDKALVTPSSFHLPGVVHLPNPKRSFSGPENAIMGPILGAFCILSQTISTRYHGDPG